jgi:hypothetical protein
MVDTAETQTMNGLLLLRNRTRLSGTGQKHPARKKISQQKQNIAQGQNVPNAAAVSYSTFQPPTSTTGAVVPASEARYVAVISRPSPGIREK